MTNEASLHYQWLGMEFSLFTLDLHTQTNDTVVRFFFETSPLQSWTCKKMSSTSFLFAITCAENCGYRLSQSSHGCLKRNELNFKL